MSPQFGFRDNTIFALRIPASTAFLGGLQWRPIEADDKRRSDSTWLFGQFNFVADYDPVNREHNLQMAHGYRTGQIYTTDIASSVRVFEHRASKARSDVIEFYAQQTGNVEPEPRPEPVIIDSAWIGSNLLKAVARDRRPLIHPAIALWMTIPDKAYKSYLTVDQFVTHFTAKTGKTHEHIIRILRAGAGIFWDVDHSQYVRFYSKQRVYDRYGLTLPGVAVRIPFEALHGKLSEIRGVLMLGVFNGRKSMVISRKQLAFETGFSKNQSLSFERAVGLQKTYQFFNNRDKPQTVNIYDNPLYTERRRKAYKKIYGDRRGNTQQTVSSPTNLKAFYDSAESLEASIKYRELKNQRGTAAHLSTVKTVTLKRLGKCQARLLTEVSY